MNVALYMLDEQTQFGEKGYAHLDALGLRLLSEDDMSMVAATLYFTLTKFLIRPREQWNLSVRALHVLESQKWDTLVDLERVSAEQIARVPNCGRLTLLEVIREADVCGYKLPNWVEAQRKLYTTKYTLLKEQQERKPRT